MQLYVVIMPFIAFLLSLRRSTRYAASFLMALTLILGITGWVSSNRIDELKGIATEKLEDKVEQAANRASDAAQELEAERSRREALKKELDQVKESSKSLKQHNEYIEISRWTRLGNVKMGSDALTTKGPLSGWSEGFVTYGNKRFRCKCDDYALRHYSDVFNREPRYPFPYWIMASCLKMRANEEWRQYAEDSLRIVKITKSIEGHHHTHDILYDELQRLISSE